MTDEALQRLRERLSSDQESVLFMRILEELIDWAGPPTMRGNMLDAMQDELRRRLAVIKFGQSMGDKLR